MTRPSDEGDLSRVQRTLLKQDSYVLKGMSTEGLKLRWQSLKIELRSPEADKAFIRKRLSNVSDVLRLRIEKEIMSQPDESRMFEVTDEEYGKTLAATGRYTNPPGWYYWRYDGPEGPFDSSADALAELRREKEEVEQDG